MKNSLIFILAGILLLSSCAPKVTTTLSKSYPPLDYRDEIKLYGINDPVPSNSVEIGNVRIGDTGFSVDCGWEVVTKKAMEAARKAGGNALKITKHTPPSVFGSSCHNIVATILKVEDFSDFSIGEENLSTIIGEDYALLHVYRFGGTGFLVSYDLYLGNDVVCRVKSNWKETIRIEKDGLNTLWAKTESKKEVPINIKFGNEYYVRCGIATGFFVGQPVIEIVDNRTGKAEIQSIKADSKTQLDKLILNDGRVIECHITDEDENKVYFTYFQDGKEIKTHINKIQIKEIQRNQ